VHPTPPVQASAGISQWIGFHIALFILLAAEYLYARRELRAPHRSPTEPRLHIAFAATALWIAASLALAFYLYRVFNTTAAVQYLAGYAIEESLSIDNLFVFLLLFRLFHIDRAHQPRVLFFGVAGAILMRGLFIAGGITLLARFDWISYVFAAILLFAAIRLLLPSAASQPSEPPRWIAWLKRLHPVSDSQQHFLIFDNGRPTVTILLLALIAIELTDVIFALDSIPAVLSITRSPFLAYTSNIMAVMGLRSLYFLLIGALARLRYLHFGLAAILAFAAVKMLASSWFQIGPLASLAVILALLAITIAISIPKSGNQPG